MKLIRATVAGLALVVVSLASGAPPAAAAPTTREFTLVAERYKFTPSRIEVNQGDTVKITARSADGTHGFGIKQLKIDEKIPKGGEPVTIQFVATEAGSFEIKCTQFCGMGHSGMKAVLVVNPSPSGGGTR
jgi:cytochrome c oxidase subunit II